MDKNSSKNIHIFSTENDDRIGAEERLNEKELQKELAKYGIEIEFDIISRHGFTNTKKKKIKRNT